jgi:hypothetical protein
MSKRTYRMYGMVPYNLSPIQQGIQFGHAVVEYSLYANAIPEDHPIWIAYNKWSVKDKTFIILNGGTTNDRRFDGEYVGTLNRYAEEIRAKGIQVARFHEPDLGDQLTAFVFLVDDRVFDREAWPDYNGTHYVDGAPVAEEFWNWKMKFDESEDEADKIVWLRNWLPKFRLA